ncbi:Bug family tripartite tricarboxylate transporter substrate binding protein [Ramlibacter sp.]|uniref:Bug family tripartite tricarboxylate transporter substrate binding protein n=1 Tax=Ramlibacter sp. TaxID=1917967 RepID=UPI003D115AA5
MKLHRIANSALVLIGCLLAQGAGAAGDKPLKVIVPAPAGGSTDIVARMVGQQMALDTGRVVVIENRPGASGAIGMQAMLQAAADGDTLVVGPNNMLVESPHVVKMPYDPLKDVISVARIARTSYVLVTGANYPAKDFKGLLAHLKTRKDKSSFANYGNGTTSHYSGLMFSEQAGLGMQNVGYAGSPPALQDVIGGQVDIMFDGMGTSLPLVNGGKLRAYAVSGKSRSKYLPDVPTMTELGYPEIQFQGQMRFYASSKLPADALGRLQAAIKKAADAPAVQKKMLDAGLEPDVSVDTAGMLAEDRALFQRNAGIVRKFNIKSN